MRDSGYRLRAAARGWRRLAACLLLAPVCAFGAGEVAPGVTREHVVIRTDAVEPAIGEDAPVAATPAERGRRARALARSPVLVRRVPRGLRAVAFHLRNRLQAPVTVRVEPGDVRAARVAMAGPPQFTIAPLAIQEVALVSGTDATQVGEADFSYTVLIGDPLARHDDSVVYAWPFPDDAKARLTQGFGGRTHSEPHSRYAIDLAVAEGTPVLAARDGVVVYLEDEYFESGLDPILFRDKANHLRILHDDGSMAVYAHLFPNGIEVQPGQRVKRGERIARSGNTGFSSGPHLHFAVQVHRDMSMQSVPFRMQRLNLPSVRAR